MTDLARAINEPLAALLHSEASTVLRTIAVLCVSRRSVYRELPGVEAYDLDRDARTFPGGMPVVAHPPCRTWSTFCRQLVKATPERYADEQELGRWCATQVRVWGGVLEQPAHSLLWDAAGLPRPGETSRGDSWSWECWQAWWGYPVKKATWLYFAGISPHDLEPWPFRLHPKGGDHKTFKQMSHNQRSRTIRPFAEWLVANARKANG